MTRRVPCAPPPFPPPSFSLPSLARRRRERQRDTAHIVADSEEMRARDEFRQSYTLCAPCDRSGQKHRRPGDGRDRRRPRRGPRHPHGRDRARTAMLPHRGQRLARRAADRACPGSRPAGLPQYPLASGGAARLAPLGQSRAFHQSRAMSRSARWTARSDLESIAGRAALAQARAADIESIAGSLTIGLASIAAGRRAHFERRRPGRDQLRPRCRCGHQRRQRRGKRPQLLRRSRSERKGRHLARPPGAGGRRVSLSSIVGPVRLRRP